MKRVVSIWLPGFATDRIARRDSRWRADPLVLAVEQGGREILAAVNGPAAAEGLCPGMPAADARALVPHVAIRPARPAADARALAALAAWATRWTPWAAPDGTDGLFLDVTGCAHLFGGEAALLDDILDRLEAMGFAAHAATADTPGAAWALARFGHLDDPGETCHLVLPGMAEAAIAPLPAAALRLAAEDARRLARLGLKRVADLMAVPRAALARRFGAGVARRLDQALGRESEAICPRLPAQALRVRRGFAEPLFATAALEEALAAMLAQLCARLARRGLGARRLALVLERAGAPPLDVEVGTAAPSRDPVHLARLFAGRLDGLDAALGIEGALLATGAAEPMAARQLGLERSGADAGGLAPLVDRLAARLGAESVFTLAPRASHLPERALVRAAPLAAPAVRPAAGPRPLRLLDPPEPVEAVAPVPDDPPLLFRRAGSVHRVARAEGPERLAPEWWRDGAAPGETTRDYYRVEDTEGQRFWLFRRGLHAPPAAPPAWFLHGWLA